MQEVTGSIPVVSTTPRTVGCSRRFFSTFKIHLLYAAAILGIRISKFLVRALRPVRPSRFPVSKLPGAFRTLFLLFTLPRVRRTLRSIPSFYQIPRPAHSALFPKPSAAISFPRHFLCVFEERFPVLENFKSSAAKQLQKKKKGD